MPKHLAERLLEEVRLDKDASLDQIVNASLDAMRRAQEQTDRDKVDAAVGGYRSGGLGVVGPEDTLDALVKGQVDELLMTANLQELQGLKGATTEGLALANDGAPEPVLAGEAAQAPPDAVRLADELVTKAAQTSARITFVQDPGLLSQYGGVAALLRFRI
jgi:peptide subunit release factor 1 (eRF1)